MAQKPTSTSQGEHARRCGRPDPIVRPAPKPGASEMLTAQQPSGRAAPARGLKRRRLGPGVGPTRKVSKVGAAAGGRAAPQTVRRPGRAPGRRRDGAARPPRRPAAPPPRRPGPPTLPRGPPARPAQGRRAHPPPSSAASSSPGSPMSGGGEGPAAAAAAAVAAGWKVPAGLQPGSRTRRPPAAPPHAPSRWHFLSRAGNPRGPPARAPARPPRPRRPRASSAPPRPRPLRARPRPLLGTLGPALAAGLSNGGARAPAPSARAPSRPARGPAFPGQKASRAQSGGRRGRPASSPPPPPRRAAPTPPPAPAPPPSHHTCGGRRAAGGR
ncbi:proline-rich protein 2-like [Phodopus roborovskii]|uniref:proline-rich protein 2-like n=1 Tax=Phodopus roborovskii TaxID=109678 RepID=UPI0021E465DF|nr:proline-rich protein 2-like [Phodopus roborovskii]